MIRILRQTYKLIQNSFDDEKFAAKIKYDLE